MKPKKPSRTSEGSRLYTCTIFLAGLCGGAFLHSRHVANNNSLSTNYVRQPASIPVEQTAQAAAVVVDNNIGNPAATTTTTTTTTKKEVQFCDANPYQRSLLPGHSFQLAEQKAQIWLTNKTAIRDAMYWKSYGKYTHDKFDAFDVMAPCQFNCTGACGADTSKIICGADTLREDPSCIIYSIGGNNNWEFEERVYDMTPCQIHTFDCTGPISRFRPPARIADRHTFHHVCLATVNVAKAEHPELVKHVAPDFSVVGAVETLQRMQERLQHTRLDLLKLDIEGYEWPIFESWPELNDIEKSSKVTLPMQILVEIHYRTAMHDLWPKPGEIFKTEIDIVELQAHLLRMGYVVAIRDDNMACPHCTELTLLRHKCLV